MSRLYSQIFSDNFHRADESPLNPANWTTASGQGDLAVSSNLCVQADASLSATEYYTGKSLSNNQYAQATIGAYVNIGANIGAIFLVVRGSVSDFSVGYSVVIDGNGDGTSTLQASVDNTTVFSKTLLAVNVGDILRVETLGNVASYLYNGSIFYSIVDSAYISGVSGPGMNFSSVASDTGVSLFQTGAVTVPTSGTIYPGIYEGSNLATAFANPSGYDLMQVVNEGGKVVWNLTSAGVTNTNPANPTMNAILGKFSGSSFATAFPNPSKLDLLQVVNEGGSTEFLVDYQGLAYTP